MNEIIWFCLLCFAGGGLLLLSAIFNWKLSHIRYLSESGTGKIISRLLIGSFGLIAIGIGILLCLAPA